ncbi:hypothetical protein F2Q69_00042777 [Brassica cretica]|uniref:Uncharacterized protein n=1 Tax=Brassica cretica TaxID=69181 RepID=A0A8S9NKG2_BRACR|nr:hypothetical protein F2Q69_00042777 [Brassica cretica]
MRLFGNYQVPGSYPQAPGSYPRVCVPASRFQGKIYAHCSTSTTLLTGSGHDLQLISRVPSSSLKHLDTSCSLQHIDRPFRNLRATLQSIQFSVRSSYPNLIHSSEPILGSFTFTPKNVQALICTRNWIKGYEAYEHEDEIDPEEETLPSFDSIANAENDDEEV